MLALTGKKIDCDCLGVQAPQTHFSPATVFMLTGYPSVLWLRRAAKVRAVLRNMSAQEEWLLSGLAGTNFHHWARAPHLDGDGEQNDDGTNTTPPDVDPD